MFKNVVEGIDHKVKMMVTTGRTVDNITDKALGKWMARHPAIHFYRSISRRPSAKHFFRAAGTSVWFDWRW